MKYLFISILGLMSVESAIAALSPFYDSAEQVRAVLESTELGDEKIYGEIRMIRRLGEMRFLVRTDSCSARVELDAHIPNNPGPTTYTVREVLNAHCQ